VAGFTAFRSPIKRRNRLRRINKGIAINFADIIFEQVGHKMKANKQKEVTGLTVTS